MLFLRRTECSFVLISIFKMVNQKQKKTIEPFDSKEHITSPNRHGGIFTLLEVGTTRSTTLASGACLGGFSVVGGLKMVMRN